MNSLPELTRRLPTMLLICSTSSKFATVFLVIRCDCSHLLSFIMLKTHFWIGLTSVYTYARVFHTYTQASIISYRCIGFFQLPTCSHFLIFLCCIHKYKRHFINLFVFLIFLRYIHKYSPNFTYKCAHHALHKK